MKAVASTVARRCAIYTRVSTDAGLEQDFNSLDNQREACEAYIKSQAQEGWRLVRDRFDDGGFSGGSMDRPALKKLLEEVKLRRIDVIVVYKVDRLTRSLADFAKLVDCFDAQDVSFISVTQAFNTTTSMGRLTLNMLLSFAQFEREITGERIRDKIAASKKKGMWMGGVVPFGYRVEDRKLLVDEAEAPIVRMIFDRYCAVGSIVALAKELKDRGILTRQRTLSSGRVIGSVRFTKGPLAHLLKNRMYLGEINHRGETYRGEHSPIVDAPVFAKAQEILTRQAAARGYRQVHSGALLLGRLFNQHGHRMTPAHAVKKGVRYRYYVAASGMNQRGHSRESIDRLPAGDLESAVLKTLRELAMEIGSELPTRTELQGDLESPSTATDRRLVEALVERVIVRPGAIEIALTSDAAEAAGERAIRFAWSKLSSQVRREIIPAIGGAHVDERSTRADVKSKLLASIAMARAWLDDLVSNRIKDVDALAQREHRSLRSTSMTLSLAFLAPGLVQAIADGRLPRGIGVTRLFDVPSYWSQQFIALGLRPQS